MANIDVFGKYGDPRIQAARANMLASAHLAAMQRGAAAANPLADSAVPWHPGRPMQAGFYGSEWMGGRSPMEQRRMQDRFESFVPRIATAGGPGRAQDFFSDLLPAGAQLAPNAGAGYKQAMQNHYDMRRRTGGSISLPGGGQLAGGNVFQQTQRPYQPEFECLTYATPITLLDGTHLLVGEAREGNAVVGSDGRVGTITRHASAGVPDELVDIETWGGEKLTVTTNHRWPAWVWLRKCLCGCGTEVRQGRCWAPNHYRPAGPKTVHKHGSAHRTSPTFKAVPVDYEPVQLTDAADLRPGDCLLIPRKFDSIETDVTEAKALLLGYWVAEGSIDERPGTPKEYCACFNFGAHEFETYSRETEDVLAGFGVAATRSVDHARGQSRVRTTNDRGRNSIAVDAMVAWLVEHGGRGACEKRLSVEVMRWPVRLKRALLTGMLRGDGSQFYATTQEGDWTSRSFTVTYTTASPALARQTMLLLAQCGFPARVVEVNEPRNRSGKHYRVDVKGGHYPRDLADLVWGEASKAREHPKSNDVDHACMMDDDYIYVPIKRVTRRPNVERAEVFTIAVSFRDELYCIGSNLPLLTKNSPDRQSYPIHRNLANIYWRLFYKMDAVIGNGVDLYSELPWSDVEFTGDGVDGEVKDTFERAWEVCNIRAMLPYFVREYLVTGEACPQCFYDKSQGIWTYVGMHNPDQLEVIHTPFIKMDPIVRFKPDNRLQQVLASGSDMVRHVRESMPPELLPALMSGQPIELHPLNFTFLPRKMHPYDVRGTSILSRMWRPLMYEDAIFNASIATARRHAGPIKVAKLGDRATGWIPDPSHEQRLLELLAQAELDPHAWIVYHYGIEFDLVGTTDRVMTIDKHWDLIERIKLNALGISKAFLHGEVTYASAASGLTVFLQRLKALREYFEAAWIIPKFFKPLSVMNAWIKPTSAELSHGVRTRRSKQDLLEDNRWIIPTLEWARQLDPSVEQAQITAVQALTTMGVVFSKQYLASLGGRDWEEELTQRAREAEIEQKLIQKNPALQLALTPPAGGEGGAGGGGASFMPGMAPESMGFPGGEPGAPGGGEGAPPGPPEAGVHAAPGSEGGPSGRQWNKPAIWQNGKCGNWDADTVSDLLRLFEGEPPDEEAWERMVTDRPAIAEFAKHGDGEGFWDAVEEWLSIEGYPAEDIMTLEDILKLERVIGGPPKAKKGFNLRNELESLEESDDSRLLVGTP